ncbi:chorismate mutase [Alcaligenaceae bacterium A4P071]|nr:chorismate mutase [Alcaligenaceae bacterium B3P038]MDQ2151455.1 chorismate mutase [Alcaligenaceae bacterium C4P045]MDQ2188061.1 chorismate mutase [Alcaligenaceae bacterium A4P071]
MTNEDDDDDMDIPALRAEINEIDQQLMLLLGLRFRCSDQLAEMLLAHGMEAPDDNAEDRIKHVEALAEDAGVSPALAVQLMHAVVSEVNSNLARIKASSQSH